MLGYKISEIQIVCFRGEGVLVFSNERSINLSGNFQLPAILLTSAAPMKYRYPILSKLLLQTEIR